VPNVLLMHGEAGEMGRLKNALAHKFANEGAHVQLLNPKNCQTVQLRFKGDKVARAVGALVLARPRESRAERGTRARNKARHRQAEAAHSDPLMSR
jgi:cleavage and polyadenylation specificity factor subunit 3